MKELPPNMAQYFEESEEISEPYKPVDLSLYRRPAAMDEHYWNTFIAPRLGKRYGETIFGDEYLIDPK